MSCDDNILIHLTTEYEKTGTDASGPFLLKKS